MLKLSFRLSKSLPFSKKFCMMNAKVQEIPDPSQMRVSYNIGHIYEKDMSKDPLEEFKHWFKLASECKSITEPNTLILCTATKSGLPSGRPLLMKAFDERGFVFYTNYQSRKSQELSENPHACLVFYWDPLHKTVRIEGEVTKVSEEESIKYFQSRPRESQLGAWASPKQSAEIQSREELDQLYEEMTKKFEGVEKLPKPDYWGGWRVNPVYYEFWQGGQGRVHDRIVYKRSDVNSKEWKISRLSP